MGPTAILRVALLVWLLAVPGTQRNAADANEVALPPVAERYRELNLVLMIAEGASREWAHTLAPGSQQTVGDRAPSTDLAPPVPVGKLQTPLNRIVDQRRTVADAARIFQFAVDRRPDIEAEIARTAVEHPDAVAALDPIQLAEDALIIRSSLIATIEYLGQDAEPAWLEGLEPYRQKTVYLRNMMEYWAFDRELSAITEQALLDTGSRIDAYRRLIEVDPRLDAFAQHLRAVEFVYRHYGKELKPPEDPSEKLIDAASRVDDP